MHSYLALLRTSFLFTTLFFFIALIVNKFIEGFSWDYKDFVAACVLVFVASFISLALYHRRIVWPIPFIIGLIALIWAELAVGVLT